MKDARVVVKFIYATCECGSHIIDLFAPVWNDRKTGFYTCNSCSRPLVCRDDNGQFYYVGNRVK